MSAPVYITAFGETKSFTEWSRDRRCVVPYQSLVQRISELGYEPERAITAPKNRGFHGRKDQNPNKRNSKYSDAQKALVLSLKITGLTVREIADEMNVPSTFVQETLSPRKQVRA